MVTQIVDDRYLKKRLLMDLMASLFAPGSYDVEVMNPIKLFAFRKCLIGED